MLDRLNFSWAPKKKEFHEYTYDYRGRGWSLRIALVRYLAGDRPLYEVTSKGTDAALIFGGRKGNRIIVAFKCRGGGNL